MDDGERFKECMKLQCVCAACRKESSFCGLIDDVTGLSGLNCPSCKAAFYGRYGIHDNAYVLLIVRH